MDISAIWSNIVGNRYLIGLGVFVVFYILAELIKFITEGAFLTFAKKTKTDLDDFLIKKTKRPFSLLLMLIGVRIAFVIISLKGKAGNLTMNIIDSLLAVVAIYIGIVMIKLVIEYWGKRFAKKTRSEVDELLVSVTKKAMNVVFFISIFLTILKIWGIEIGPLLAGLGIGGVAIAFALQKSLGNIFGGISMILDRSIKVGERICLDDDTIGEVLDIGLRSTKIKTLDNEYIVVPNGKLSEMNIENITKPEPSIRLVVPFGVAYGSKVEEVKKIVLKEIDKVDGLDKGKDKEPVVRFSEMGDSALLFKAYFYIKNYEDMYDAKDQANTLIYNALNKKGISIPFPQMDVHLKKK